LSEKFVNGLEWRPLHAVDQKRFREARLQAHHASQWLARTARAYIPSQPDDHHTSLSWDHVLEGFTTDPLLDGTWLSLQLPTLTLALHDGDRAAIIDSLSLNDRRDPSVCKWLGEILGARSLDPRALYVPSPYEIPTHAIVQGTAYDSIGSKDCMVELVAWFANAELLLGHVQGQMTGRKLTASLVRCWPHHFDLATLITLAMRSSGTTGYVGVGFSPGDDYYDEPYFYVSVYPDPDAAILPSLPKLGHWHTREFTAAVMPAHKLLAAQNQRGEADNFLQVAVTAAIGLLG
jgi:hypothetical protein